MPPEGSRAIPPSCRGPWWPHPRGWDMTIPQKEILRTPVPDCPSHSTHRSPRRSLPSDHLYRTDEVQTTIVLAPVPGGSKAKTGQRCFFAQQRWDVAGSPHRERSGTHSESLAVPRFPEKSCGGVATPGGGSTTWRPSTRDPFRRGRQAREALMAAAKSAQALCPRGGGRLGGRRWPGVLNEVHVKQMVRDTSLLADMTTT